MRNPTDPFRSREDTVQIDGCKFIRVTTVLFNGNLRLQLFSGNIDQTDPPWGKPKFSASILVAPSTKAAMEHLTEEAYKFLARKDVRFEYKLKDFSEADEP